MGDLRVPDLNKVIVAGRLTRDPELRYTPQGKPWCRISIANTRYFKGSDGERREDTAFIDVTVWGPMAEFVGERLKKGRPVIVDGSLRSSEWEDKESGQKRRKLEVNAQRVAPLDWDDDRPGGGGGGSGHGGAERGSAPSGYSGGGGDRGGAPSGYSGGTGGRPAPRHIEEPIPEDDIPF
jgi:single-strand DNA-binding protein